MTPAFPVAMRHKRMAISIASEPPVANSTRDVVFHRLVSVAWINGSDSVWDTVQYDPPIRQCNHSARRAARVIWTMRKGPSRRFFPSFPRFLILFHQQRYNDI